MQSGLSWVSPGRGCVAVTEDQSLRGNSCFGQREGRNDEAEEERGKMGVDVSGAADVAGMGGEVAVFKGDGCDIDVLYSEDGESGGDVQGVDTAGVDVCMDALASGEDGLGINIVGVNVAVEIAGDSGVVIFEGEEQEESVVSGSSEAIAEERPSL